MTEEEKKAAKVASALTALGAFASGWLLMASKAMLEADEPAWRWTAGCCLVCTFLTLCMAMATHHILRPGGDEDP